MRLTQQRELAEEVSREMVLDKAFKILMQRLEWISSFDNNSNMFGGSQIHLGSHFLVGNNRQTTHINKDKVNQQVSV